MAKCAPAYDVNNVLNVDCTTEKGYVNDSDFDDTRNEPMEEDEETDSLRKHGTKDVTLINSIRKTDMSSKNHRKIHMLAHTLKRLTHEGKVKKFDSIVSVIIDRCIIRKPKFGKCVPHQMQINDILFTALDAQIEAKRLKYGSSLTDNEILSQMERLIVFTSDPNVSSMVYMARHGSAPYMKTTLKKGLVYLQYAKQHCEHIAPCKDTGLMYYLEANLLSHIYELTPATEMKENILKSIENAMDQFINEDDDIRNDYTRMLMIRKAYCFLGLNLFGKKIMNACVKQSDKQEAKKCLDFVEQSDIWRRMENRRKMLYFIAKAEYYRQEHIFDQAKINAKKAEHIAHKNDWMAERSNVTILLDELESYTTVDDSKASGDDLGWVEEEEEE